MKFSVVVPVCNVERYLSECLESILAQKTFDMEVICVNDGSTDGSLSILKRFSESDDRVLIIDKLNSGYGDSLNIGIDKASGHYVGIVESDDVVIAGMFEKMLSIAEKTNAELIKGTFNFYTSEPMQRKTHPNFKDFPCEKITSIEEHPELFFTAPSIWSAIYKKSFLDSNKIRFLPTPGASYQDTAFAFKVWAAAKSVYLLSEPVIDYRQDSAGSSSNVSKKVFNIFNETAEMERFLIENRLERFFPEFVRTKFISYSWTLARLNQIDRKKFFLRWIPELKSEFEKGFFVRKYWDDYNWNYIHQLVFNPDANIDALSCGSLVASPSFDSFRWFGDVYPVYIYGAGKYAKIALQKLQEKKIRVSAFVVSDINGNPCNIEGIPVISLDRIDKDGIIFIGVSEKFKSEVMKILSDNWLLNNIFEI